MKTYTKVTIVLVLIPILIAIYFLFKFTNKNEFIPENNVNYVVDKKGVNEYTPIHVSEDDMANLYFTTFISMMINNAERSYSYLEINYRENRFPSLNSYKEYIKSLTNNYAVLPKMYKYKIDFDENNRKIYFIKDTYNNDYIFVTDGVMNYQVYLDENAINLQ